MAIIKDNFAFYIEESKENIIYNKITDPDTKVSLYPDILFPHNFSERELINHDAYVEGEKLLSEYGSAHCIFLSFKDGDSFNMIVSATLKTDIKNHCGFDNNEFIRFCDDLSLSVTMKNMMQKLLTYYSYHGNVSELISKVNTDYRLPVSKPEGKKIYEKIREFILQ